MASLRDIGNFLLESFDDDDISEDEFLLLYDVNTSKNADFLTTAMECSNNTLLNPLLLESYAQANSIKRKSITQLL